MTGAEAGHTETRHTETGNAETGNAEAGHTEPSIASLPPLRRNVAFQLLWTGTSAATLGVSVADIAYPLVILAVTRSPALAGLFAATQGLGMLLAGLPAGVLADRYDSRVIVIVTEAVRAAVTAAVVTALADNAVGRLVQDLIYQGGVDQSHIHWAKFDGVGRQVRNGLNFTERGFGVRAALGCSDRGHTAVSQLRPGDIDWEKIFAEQGAQCPRRHRADVVVGAVYRGTGGHRPGQPAPARPHLRAQDGVGRSRSQRRLRLGRGHLRRESFL